MNFIPRENVEWVSTKIIKTSDVGPVQDHTYAYEFLLPRPLADWDVWDYWEKERFASMSEHLKQGMTLFDIGTEQGWCNLIYALFVGPQNMVLIEPTQEFWPNIQATWEKNFKLPPKATYVGLLSDKTTVDRNQMFHNDWPPAANGDLIDRNKYQYIHDNEQGVPETTLDDMVANTGIVPDALTMDTEGAELLILRGAEKTLKQYKPLLWVSVHPDLGERDYGITKDDTLNYLASLGYKGTHLATDHEEHWFFEAV